MECIDALSSAFLEFIHPRNMISMEFDRSRAEKSISEAILVTSCMGRDTRKAEQVKELTGGKQNLRPRH